MAYFDTDFIQDGSIAAAKLTDTYIPSSEKGAVNGVATLDGSGKVPTAQLPSYVDDVLEFADLASFPVSGETGKIYVAIDTGKTYRWTGSVYVEISPSEVNSVNSQTGVVVLDTDDIGEGATNLYFTDARAKSAAVDDTVYGVSWDGVTDVAPSKNAVYDKIEALAASAATDAVELFTLSAGDITNGYIELAQNAISASILLSVAGAPSQYRGDDYTISVPVSVTRLTFAGNLATILTAGKKLEVHYRY